MASVQNSINDVTANGKPQKAPVKLTRQSTLSDPMLLDELVMLVLAPSDGKGCSAYGHGIAEHESKARELYTRCTSSHESGGEITPSFPAILSQHPQTAQLMQNLAEWLYKDNWGGSFDDPSHTAPENICALLVELFVPGWEGLDFRSLAIEAGVMEGLVQVGVTLTLPLILLLAQ